MEKTLVRKQFSSILSVFGALLLFSFSAQSQSELLTGENQIIDSGVRSIIVHHTGNELSPPFIELDLGALEVRFDDLGRNFRNLYYTVYLCTANWEFSALEQSEYITGFSENYISEYEQSFNTLVDFTHYKFSFPNNMSGVNRSGNYLLVVYEEGDTDNILFANRFVVYENMVTINGRIKESTMVTERNYMQEIDFVIEHPNFEIPNPYSDLEIAILQNNRWDNAVVGLEPRFVKNRELDYDYGEENNFDAGNEFREYDLKQLDFITSQIARVEQQDDGWHCWLKPDPNRAFLQYKTVYDLNGQFYIKNDDGFDRHLEADYVWMHFTMPFDFPLPNSKVYVFGALSNWMKHPDFEMKYDYEKKQYSATILLKQGFYNYTYVIDGPDTFQTRAGVEGNHYVTENDYTIIAYNYDFSNNYYRVIGIQFLNNYKQN